MIPRYLPRRSFLRGLGTAIALPWLDSMVPAFGAKTLIDSNAPCRLSFIYVPNGIIMENWTPTTKGSNFKFPSTLTPLKEYQKDCLLLSGLTHNNGRALGDGPGDHARAAASYLTGVHPKKTQGSDIQNGISVDQIVAQSIGSKTRLPSLELGTEHTRIAGNCDSGYSCAYNNSISWRTPSSPLPPEVNPRAVFDRLFGENNSTSDSDQVNQRYRPSIIDLVQEDTKKLITQLGPADRRKLDEYLFAIRQIEKQIEINENINVDIDPNMERPQGIPIDFAEHLRLMYDLQAVAFQTDLTRVSTLMIGREGSNRTYREIGVSGAHHGLTHHGGDKVKIEQISKINRYHIEQFKYFLDKLKSIPDGEGSLLDNTMIVYGSGISDGDKHLHDDLPVLVAGGGQGTLKTGRHVRYEDETPLTNLYLSMLDRMEIKLDVFGDSTGELKLLSDI